MYPASITIPEEEEYTSAFIGAARSIPVWKLLLPVKGSFLNPKSELTINFFKGKIKLAFKKKSNSVPEKSPKSGFLTKSKNKIHKLCRSF